MSVTAEGPRVTAAIRTSTVNVGDYSLLVHQVGDPALPTVLWLHGSGPGVSALSNWEALITSIPDFHHVAPDILGYGRSSHPDPAPVGMKAYTELRVSTNLALLDALGIARTHVVGNSMGGMITLEMLRQSPDRFDRLVLMGSGGSPTPPTEALVSMVMYYENPGPDAMKNLMRRFVHDTTVFADRLDEIAADRAATAADENIRRSHLATFDFTGGPVRFEPDFLATVDNEVLVVHGREDQMIPFEAGVYFATHLPNAQLHLLPHAGHWVQIEQVDRFRAQAELFLGEGPGEGHAPARAAR